MGITVERERRQSRDRGRPYLGRRLIREQDRRSRAKAEEQSPESREGGEVKSRAWGARTRGCLQASAARAEGAGEEREGRRGKRRGRESGEGPPGIQEVGGEKEREENGGERTLGRM